MSALAQGLRQLILLQSLMMLIWLIYYLTVDIVPTEQRDIRTGNPSIPTQAPLALAPSDSLSVSKSWQSSKLKLLWDERKMMGHTPLYRFTLPARSNVHILFKNESSTPSGSLKHRYAWALIAWALLEDHIKENTIVYEASSGNTAASLAYMCKLIGVNFTAIVPDTLEKVKEEHITQYNGRVVRVPIAERLDRARKMAEENNGFFMNQFGNSYYAEEFHESGNFGLESTNMFHEIFTQMNNGNFANPIAPRYFVHAAGTGGTITSIGRYIKKHVISTQVVVADTEFSIYYDYIINHRFTNVSGNQFWVTPGMAGIGYSPDSPAILGKTTSLDPAVIDRALKIPDLASTAALQVLRKHGINGGTSTGVNFVAALHLAAQDNSKEGFTIGTILADIGNNYETSYFNRTWIQENFNRPGSMKSFDCWQEAIEKSIKLGDDPLANSQCFLKSAASHPTVH